MDCGIELFIFREDLNSVATQESERTFNYIKIV